MRGWMIGIAALGLAGCDSAQVEPADSNLAESNSAQDAAQIDPSRISLDGDRLTVGAESFYFNAGRAEVENALGRAMGGEGESTENKECGAGPMVMTTYADGLTVNFAEGQLVGWLLQDGSDNIVVESGIDIGTPRDRIEGRAGFERDDESTLGEEFFSKSDAIGAMIGDDGSVTAIYAGTQCFFR